MSNAMRMARTIVSPFSSAKLTKPIALKDALSLRLADLLALTLLPVGKRNIGLLNQLLLLAMSLFSFSYLEFLGPGDWPLIPSCAPRRPHAPSSVPLNYQTALNDLREILDSMGYNGRDFGEHSMKRGAATSSHEAGVSEPDIQTEGGWSSSRTVKLYIDKGVKSSQRIAQILSNRN
jgi:hypothetical protein